MRPLLTWTMNMNKCQALVHIHDSLRLTPGLSGGVVRYDH